MKGKDMKFIKALAVSAAMTAFVGTAHADDGAYVNVGVDTLEFDNFGIGAKIGTTFAGGTFGVEAQGSLGVIDDEVTIGTTDIDVGYDYIAGAFVTVNLPVGRNITLISRTGYYFSEFSASDGTNSASESIDGFAGGTGIQYMFGENDGIRLDYTWLDGGSNNGDANTGSISYVRKF